MLIEKERCRRQPDNRHEQRERRDLTGRIARQQATPQSIAEQRRDEREVDDRKDRRGANTRKRSADPLRSFEVLREHEKRHGRNQARPHHESDQIDLPRLFRDPRCAMPQDRAAVIERIANNAERARERTLSYHKAQRGPTVLGSPAEKQVRSRKKKRNK